VAIQSTSSVVVPRSSWMAGMATFTIVTSSTDMNIPTISTSRDTTHDAPGADSPPRTGGSPGAGAGSAAPAFRSFAGWLVRSVELVRVMAAIVT
jgi:hypothetical protein